jgi:hypothetical protein
LVSGDSVSLPDGGDMEIRGDRYIYRDSLQPLYSCLGCTLVFSKGKMEKIATVIFDATPF